MRTGGGGGGGTERGEVVVPDRLANLHQMASDEGKIMSILFLVKVTVIFIF